MIQPLSKKIYKEAKQRGIETIELKFQGGGDEGYLNILFEPYNENNDDFEETVKEWIWDVYEYSGAGDGGGGGADYGDNITYNLVDNTVSHEEWYMKPTYNDNGDQKLELNDE